MPAVTRAGWPELDGDVRELEVMIDVPRGSFIKRDDDGRVDYVSPLPCPFNYGSVPGTLSGDGDRLDALVLGARLARGARGVVPVVGFVEVLDAGQRDPKYICARRPLSLRDKLLVSGFFAAYAHLKSGLNRLRGTRGPTRYGGIIEFPRER